MLVLPVNAPPLVYELDIVEEEGVFPQLGLGHMEFHECGLRIQEGGIILP